MVTYDELPRDEEKFPGNSPEYYPDYIGGASYIPLVVTNVFKQLFYIETIF